MWSHCDKFLNNQEAVSPQAHALDLVVTHQLKTMSQLEEPTSVDELNQAICGLKNNMTQGENAIPANEEEKL